MGKVHLFQNTDASQCVLLHLGHKGYTHTHIELLGNTED